MYKLVTVLLLLTGVNMAAQADLGVPDPTLPVYMAAPDKTGQSQIEDNQDEIDKTIPELTQLIFSPSRKIAIFGETVVRIGDSVAFGEILNITQNSVFVKIGDEIKRVNFFDEIDGVDAVNIN